jgi:TM2 domain-containing membrane protein YozV
MSEPEEQKLETVPCPYCRGMVLVGAPCCKYCQASLSALWPAKQPAKSQLRKPLLASLLSVFFPGLGQYYCGRPDKALLFVILFIILVGLLYWLVFPWIIVAVWAGVDAYLEARRIPEG